ncbi:MAG: ubiquinone/menaquinone biosynthesis methyltransferase [Anaerolineae bacterium]
MADVGETFAQQSTESDDPADPPFSFADIARRYDALNRLMSLGRDHHWRRIAAEAIGVPAAGRVLDVGVGTGDMALALVHRWPGSTVVGVDSTVEMMRVGQRRPDAEKVRWTQGDALHLPFPNATFDAVVSVFLLRNVADVPGVLAEQRRVVRCPEPACPERGRRIEGRLGGRVVCLEMTWPRTPGLRTLFRFYFATLMPLITGMLSGQPAAYRYLPRSVERFLTPEELKATMEHVGLQNVRYRMLALGTVALHVGER